MGGVVAHNDAPVVANAIRSLLDQRLPEGAYWQKLLVVASGCTDGTARSALGIDPRVEVIEEAERRGKSAALETVLSRANGATHLVLLNADAEAMPGSVAALLDAGAGRSAPWAAMPRLVAPEGRPGRFSQSIELLWELHDRFHAFVAAEGAATNLSDELLVLSAGDLPPLREGIVNDGSFIGAWLSRRGAPILYVPEGEVRIESARRFRDHVRQRARIRYGHGQVLREVGVAPMTLQRWALAHPASAIRFLWRVAQGRREGLRLLLPLAAAEGLGLAWATGSRWRPGGAPIRWPRAPRE